MKLSERLHAALAGRFGNDWRQKLTVAARIDKLYWLVFLAEIGLAEQEKRFRAEGMDASAAASLASWYIDLEQLVEAIQTAPVTDPTLKRRKE